MARSSERKWSLLQKARKVSKVGESKTEDPALLYNTRISETHYLFSVHPTCTLCVTRVADELAEIPSKSSSLSAEHEVASLG